MIRPTGKTAPPRNLTKPGFDSVRPGEPPDTISESSPPNESITPAATCAHRRYSQGNILQLSDNSRAHCFEENQVRARPMLRDAALDHIDRNLGGFEGARGVKAGHSCARRRNYNGRSVEGSKAWGEHRHERRRLTPQSRWTIYVRVPMLVCPSMSTATSPAAGA